MQLNFRENNLYEIFIRSKKTVCYMSVCVKWVSRVSLYKAQPIQTT